MAVLHDYAPQPIHKIGWPSTSSNAPFPSRTCTRFDSLISKGSPLVRMYTRHKRYKSQLDKLNKSTALPLPASKKNKINKRTLPAEESQRDKVISCLPVPKSILIKPSSQINLYQSNSPVTEIKAVAALIAGSTTVHSPSVPNSDKPVTKKVRFSISRPKNSVLQARLCSLQPQQSVADLASKEKELDLLHSHLEPVAETIFFTHSRYSYDRSPITVDKVLNKSLDLPPRTSINAFCAGRWLPQPGSTDCCEVEEIPLRTVTENTRVLNSNTISVMPQTITPWWNNSSVHSVSVADNHLEGPEYYDPKSVTNGCDTQDGLNDSSLLFTSPDACATVNWMERFNTPKNSLHFKSDETLASMKNQHHQLPQSQNDASIEEEKVTYSFSSLKIGGNLDETENYILEVDEIVGIGNWTRTQVFGSWDALDGF